MTTIIITSYVNRLKNIITRRISSTKMKEFLNDESSRLILPSNGKNYNNEDLFEYNNLKLNTLVKTWIKMIYPKISVKKLLN